MACEDDETSEVAYGESFAYVANRGPVVITASFCGAVARYMPRDEHGEFRGRYWNGVARLTRGGIERRPHARPPLLP